MTTDPSDLLASMPFSVAMGVVIDGATAEEVRGHLDWAADRCTVESKTNFFRGVRSGDGPVAAAATPLHAGRTTIVIQTDLRDAAGRRVALVTQTQAVIAARSA